MLIIFIGKFHQDKQAKKQRNKFYKQWVKWKFKFQAVNSIPNS